MEYKVTVSELVQNIENYHIGDSILLSGTIYTARDQAHKRLIECLNDQKDCPFDLNGSAIYYMGPSPEKPGQVIGSAGPTTSCRMDDYSPILLQNGNKIMIGKGKRSQQVIDSIVANKAIYLAALGGAGALLSSCIHHAEIIAFEDLGCEAIRRLSVEDLPLTVCIDSFGHDLYKEGPTTYLNSNF